MSIATLPATQVGTTNPDKLYEIVFGEIVEKEMSAGAIWIAGEIHSALNTFVTARRMGWAVQECLFVLDAALNLKRRPDVAFVSVAQWPFDREPPMEDDWHLA